jgi:membrane protein involved in colicin uptake
MSQNPIAISFDSFRDIKAAVESTLDEVRELAVAPGSRVYAINANLNCVLMMLAKAEETEPSVTGKFDFSMVDPTPSHSEELEAKISKLHSVVTKQTEQTEQTQQTEMQEDSDLIDEKWLAEYSRVWHNKQKQKHRNKQKRENPEKYKATKKAERARHKARLTQLEKADPEKYSAAKEANKEKQKARLIKMEMANPEKFAAHREANRLKAIRYREIRKKLAASEESSNQQSIFDAVGSVKPQAK